MKCPSLRTLSTVRDFQLFGAEHAPAVDDATLRHVETCPRCRATLADWQGLQDAGQGLGTSLAPVARLDEAEAQLLEAALAPEPSTFPVRPQQWWMRSPSLAAAAAVGLLAGTAVLARAYLYDAPAAEPEAPTVATIQRPPPMRFARVALETSALARVEREGEDERLRLVSGRADVEVDHLEAGQRFRVMTADAEVEVRGTAFTVRATRGELQAVDVREGKVEVRWRGEAPVLLSPGDRWSLDAAHEASEDAFAEAFSALEAGDPSVAALGFARAAALGPRSATSEDARFWRGVALARAGQAEAARVAFDRFLTRHGASARAPEVHAMLGQLLLEAGRAKEALLHFDVAVRDGDDRLVGRARAGLEAAQAVLR